jgi:two-component system chemotaxis response regulator CheB
VHTLAKQSSCHTGHGFTAEALLEAAVQSTGDKIWQLTRSLQETEMLLEHMGRHIQESGDSIRAEKFFAKARELGKQASRIQQLAVEHESLNSENVEQQQPADD